VDFLDGWLNLVEKLLNTQSIMDSPHVIATASSTLTATTPQQQLTFDSLKFSMKAQQVCNIAHWLSHHLVALLVDCLMCLL